jgi:gliding motility-associated-like protein
MKKVLLLLLLFYSLTTLAQGEANIWYFGEKAGLDFTSGNPVPLVDGQLDTAEGCATISNAAGQLLFYTDGITVYNRIHQIMANGTGLMGDTSTTQSATIVPKPGSTTLYYVFTLDSFAGVKGFRYSIVDISLNGGLGAVTADKNILVYTPTNEKLSIVKHANTTDFWVVTHGWNDNNFYSHLLSSSGLSATSVVSSVGIVSTGITDNAWGYMKISPDGTKIAICQSHLGLQLLDFDNATGIISNPQTLYLGFTYGVEFSPNNNVLYVSDLSSIFQFDLTSSNIPSTKNDLAIFWATAIQLGPNNKIYVGNWFEDKLAVINNPNTVGSACDIQLNGVFLSGKKCKLGLPPFVSSFFFTPAIQFNNACQGQSVSFNVTTGQPIITANWDFGDGTTSTNPSPSHVYSVAGPYTVTAIITTSAGTGTNTREIIIHPNPILNASIVTLKQCDDNLDGFSAFNLQESIPLLVTSATGLTFSFYETAADAQAETSPITNNTNYANQVVSTDFVFVRVENTNGCFAVAQLNLVVSTTLIPSTFQRVFTQCDDVASGTNTDGIATFDFSSVTAQIQALYPPGQLITVSYYKNIADALAESNAITNTASYTNIGSPTTQTIYIRVDSQLNNECLGLGQHITLKVEAIPIVQPMVVKHCDDDQDGSYGFDTTNLQTTLLNGLTNVSVSYTDALGNALPSPLPNPFATSSQTITARVTNVTPKACFFDTTVQFIVDDLPEAFAVPTTLTTVCDDEANPELQDGIFSFNTSTFQATILGSQTGMTIHYYDASNTLLSSPLPNPFTTATQNITVEVINPINTTCKATLTIPFIVQPVPVINLLGNELICSDNPNFTKVIDAGLVDVATSANFTYTWYLNNVLLPTANQYSLTVNTAGIYTVSVENALGCSRTRTITVIASNIATINDIEVTDLTDENSIVVLATGLLNDYSYSLDNEVFQDSNVFSNLLPGIYTVYVKDNNGCGIANEEVSVLGIPKYFTPNSDGFNDFWNIKGVSENFYSQSIIYIFDRFGKLVKQISPLSQGWDGTYNGQELNSEDYWYSIQLDDGRLVKGHFCLKR